MKQNKDAPAEVDAVIADSAPSVAADNTEQQLSLQEFCQRLSSVDKRVELIGAFHYTETAAGTVKDLGSAYAARFAAFLNKPV